MCFEIITDIPNFSKYAISGSGNVIKRKTSQQFDEWFKNT